MYYNLFHNDTEEHYENVTQPPLQVNERVVWISDIGPERGTVKWIGHLYDTRDGEWTVGVDFVRTYVFYVEDMILCGC